MRVLSVVGARPQFIKAAPVSKALRARGHEEILVHTGQHYDRAMSQVFFDDLEIPEPDVNLEVGSGLHGWQTGQMLVRLEEVVVGERPDLVLVYGDTNSTLAGALTACKAGFPLAHVEAGLRSYNRAMPEEHNRVIADHCSDLLFCPTGTAVDNLAREGIDQGVHLVGDTMYDAVLEFAPAVEERSDILRTLGVEPKHYVLATVHRPQNTDARASLTDILGAILELDEPVVFPVHPRTRARINALDAGLRERLARSAVRLIDPIGYLDMLMLERNARVILTDSGGMQKEAYYFQVPCVTLRGETEWMETVDSGWNLLVGTNPASILEAVKRADRRGAELPALFGSGDAAERIVAVLDAADLASTAPTRTIARHRAR